MSSSSTSKEEQEKESTTTEKKSSPEQEKKDTSSDEEKEDDKFLKKEEEFKKYLENQNQNQNLNLKIDTSSIEGGASDLITVREKLQSSRKVKLFADGFLRAQKFEQAIEQYKQSINVVIDGVDSSKVDIEILENIKKEIIIPCYQNIVFCYIKLKKWIKGKSYGKKILELDKSNIKAKYRLCLCYIYLGHLKKADNLLEELETVIGGSKELEELENIYDRNKLNSEGNNGEFLRRMGRKLKNGKINLYKDKKNLDQIEKELKEKEDKINEKKNKNKGFFRNMINYFLNCCKKKKKSE